MPSIVTHYLFAEDVLNHSTNKIQQELTNSIELYHIFAQSFDNLFYYNLLNIKKGNKIRKFGNLAQRQNTALYFQNIIINIKKNHLENNSEALAYLYGSLTHYLLDSHCHPFIIFQAGWIDEENPKFKYRGNHEEIEVNIDAILYQEKKKRPLYQAKLSNILLPKVKFSKELKELMNQTFLETFQKEKIGEIYEKSTNQGHNILKYFVTDHLGIKKESYKIFDAIFFKNKTKYQNLSFYVKNPKIAFLNRTHELWSNPINNALTSTESFDELYQKALNKALEIFALTDKILNNQIQLNDYLKRLGNNSYTTGLDCKIKENYRYFKN